MRSLISLELNEINFDFVDRYVAKGQLPNFGRMIGKYEIFETVAEDRYPHLEPWIQWPTVYNGKTFDDHGLFRLGDVVGAGHEQIWETLAARGVSVGAISPMNAENRCPSADFFVPDPWTVTPVTGDRVLAELSALISEVVNGNAHQDGGMARLARRLMPFVLRYASVRSWSEYARILRLAKRYKWARAAFLDRFLADVFLKLRDQHSTQFATLFLNAGAHIQHHHLFESAVYDGGLSNPDWYSTAKADGIDPLLFIYQVYDQILADMMRLSGTRLLVTTGLSQVANPQTIYQYRFTDHRASLVRLGVEGFELAPRMSRDFLLTFADRAAAEEAMAAIDCVTCQDEPFFTVEDRGDTLFCQISYFGPREGLARVMVGEVSHDLSDEIVLVSIENGIHRTIGFHADTAILRSATACERPQMSLTAVFDKMRDAFDGAAQSDSIAA